MKKILWFALIIATFGILMAGCGGSSETPGADVAAGQELFNQTVIGVNGGCVTCHSIEEGVVIVGPSLVEWSHKAEEYGEDFGMTAEEFTRGAILDPNAFIEKGFPADTMPAYWGEVLTEEEVDNLVAFLLSLD